MKHTHQDTEINSATPVPNIAKQDVILHVCETSKGGIGSYLALFSSPPNFMMKSAVVLPRQHANQLTDVFSTYTFERTSRGFLSLLRMVVAAQRAAASEKPDVLFFHSTFSLFALIYFRLTMMNATMIYCPHGWAVSRYPKGSLKGRIVSWIEGTLPVLADRVVNISDHDLRVAQENKYLGKHTMIENAVLPPQQEIDTPSSLASLDPNCLNLLFVGRLDRQKGIDTLIETCNRVSKVRDDIKIHIVGGSVIEDDAYVLEEADHIVLHGWISSDQIDAFYKKADALVVSSRWEGFGLVAPEAFRNGTPAIVSKAGALPDLVSEGKTGFICDMESDELYELLLTLQKPILHAMQYDCIDVYSKRFTATRFIAEFKNLLHQITEQRPAKVLPKQATPLTD